MNGLGDGELRAVESPSLFESGRCNETAHADLLVHGCSCYFGLLLFGVVRGDRFSYHVRELPSFETGRPFLHRRDGSTVTGSSDAPARRLGPACESTKQTALGEFLVTHFVK